ncbi:MAG: zinc ribbon domain-containing protein [Dehalococcoidia bacterium]|nr:zinc ribbon domain-containing protein [Dehalococcoidia bacterium]
MPIYEYKCKTCDLMFEVKRGFSESSGASCPKCQCQAQRIFSPVPIVFKGPGFYVTDNASDARNRYNSRRDGEKPSDEPAGEKAGEKRAEAEAPKPAESKA